MNIPHTLSEFHLVLQGCLALRTILSSSSSTHSSLSLHNNNNNNNNNNTMWWQRHTPSRPLGTVSRLAPGIPKEAYPLFFAFGFVFGLGTATAVLKVTKEEGDVIIKKEPRHQYPWLSPEEEDESELSKGRH